MSKRDWDNTGLYIVLWGLVFCCAVALGWSELSGQAPHPVANDYESSKYAQSAKARIKALCVGMTGSDLAECIIKIEQSERDNHRSQKDLKAQRYMAIWAFVMAASSVLTAGITGAGLYWIRRTFTQTQGALDSANATVDVTRDIGNRQLRPYAFCSEVTWDKEDERVLLHIKNAGQAPAENVQVFYDIHPIANRERLNNGGVPMGGSNDLGHVFPSATFVTKSAVPAWREDLYQNQTSTQIKGHLTYWDPLFKETRKTKFNFVANGELGAFFSYGTKTSKKDGA